MYLSRIKLNTQIRNTLKLFNSQQVAHAAIEGAFGENGSGRKLWRLDYYKGQPYILLLSPERPDLTSFIAQFGYADAPAEIKNYQKVLDAVENGDVYKFRLTANPVHSIKKEDKDRGKIYPHVTVAQQEEWLRLKSTKNGFKLHDFAVVYRERKRFRRQDRYVSISMATYEGVLEITDAEAFKKALTDGIGRAKSYGCGLLTLARL